MELVFTKITILGDLRKTAIREGLPLCVSWREKCPNLKSDSESEGRNLNSLFPGLCGGSFAHR